MKFSHITDAFAKASGSPWAVTASVLLVALWAATGPSFGWSEEHSLFINTATTIITFWMAFIIQSTQNRDQAALQAKLDELIRSSNARNDFIGIDQKSEEEIVEMREDLK
jgi:low affinity Fe/Cu permease